MGQNDRAQALAWSGNEHHSYDNARYCIQGSCFNEISAMLACFPRLIALSALLAANLAPAQTQESDPTPTTAGVWNQWRGPDRSGHCPGDWWPKRLVESSVKQQWRVELGPSYSGPVVDESVVYTTETIDKEDEVVTAFDRKTGKKLWSTSWPGAMRVPFFASKNGSWIRSTPALDEDSIYVAGMRDVLVCLDKLTGKERWRVDFVERFETPMPDFGFVCSPLVAGPYVYAQAGASVVKLDKKSGETVWRSMNDGGGMFGSAFSSPVVATIAGKKQLIVQSREALAGIDIEDGSVLWQKKVRAFRGMNILTPQPYGDAVFTSAYGGRAHMFNVASEEDAFAVKEAWNNRAQGNMTSPVVIGKYAYLYLRAKRMACVDLETGEECWRSGNLSDDYWSLVAQGDQILALSDAGELHLIKHNPKEMEIVDTFEISEGKTWAHLAIDDGQILLREQDGLAAWSWQ
jgi:outer membrane protein assembly factor BamB